MLSKLKKIGGYLSYAIASNAVYWLALYFGYTWLAGYSIIYGFIWNLALIIFALIFDVLMHKMLQSEKFVSKLKERKSKYVGIDYKSTKWILDSFISFKTVLYIFYIFILIFSQISALYPDMLNNNFGNFIRANDYSILLLLAIDTVIGQFTKDRKKAQETAEKFEKAFKKDQEQEQQENDNNNQI